MEQEQVYRFTIRNLPAAFARMAPRRFWGHLGVGIFLRHGHVYAADKSRILAIPSDYSGPPALFEWGAAVKHLQVDNTMRLLGPCTYLNGVQVFPAFSDERVGMLRVFRDEDAEFPAWFSIEQGDLLRALYYLRKCAVIGMDVHGGTATFFGEPVEKEDTPKVLRFRVPCDAGGSPALLYFDAKHLKDAAALPAVRVRFDVQDTAKASPCAWRSVQVSAGEYVERISPVVMEREIVERDSDLALAWREDESTQASPA